jgi:hypothetical protein
MHDEFSKTIEHCGNKIEVYTYKNDNDIAFYIDKDDYNRSEFYFYLNIDKAKELIEVINEAIIKIEGGIKK